MSDKNLSPTENLPLFSDIRQLIDEARQRAAVAVNSEISLLYWRVGDRIRREILKGERAEYGKQIIAALARRLTETYGKGWKIGQLRYCLKFAEAFPDIEIVHTLCEEFKPCCLSNFAHTVCKIQDALLSYVVSQLTIGNWGWA